MNTRKIWVYLAVLLTVAGVFLLLEFVFLKKNPEPTAASLFNLTPGAIQEIHWQRGAERIELKKSKSWEIVKPLQTAADPLVLEGVLQGLVQLRPERRFPPAGKDLTEFGLQPPRSVIRFFAQGKWQEIRIGSPTAVGNTQYLQVEGSSDIYLVEAFILKELDRDVMALREKRLFSLPVEQINGLELRRGPAAWQLIKTEKGWIESGASDRLLGKNKVESFITELIWAKARSFLEAEQENPAWGLQNPRFRVVLTGQGNQKTEETLWIGAEAPNRGVYARSSRFASALVIDGALIDKIPRDMAEWQEKPESKTPEPLREDKKGS